MLPLRALDSNESESVFIWKVPLNTTEQGGGYRIRVFDRTRPEIEAFSNNFGISIYRTTLTKVVHNLGEPPEGLGFSSDAQLKYAIMLMLLMVGAPMCIAKTRKYLG